MQTAGKLQDFTLALAAKSPGDLAHLREEIARSRRRLEDSNALMQALLKNEIKHQDTPLVDADDVFELNQDTQIYRDAMRENTGAIETHDAQVRAIDAELALRSASQADHLDQDSGVGHVTRSKFSSKSLDLLSSDNDRVDATAPNGVIY